MSEKPDVWGARILPLLPGDIKVDNMGGGFYQVDFPRIAQTGANVVTDHMVPFPHRIVGLYIKQVDAALDDAVAGDTLTFSAKFRLRDIFNFAMAAFVSDNPDEAFLFRSDEGVHNACSYEFNTNATAGHFVYITIFLQALGEI